MMSVLITRPGQDGEMLCNALKEQGIMAFHHSLITYSRGNDYKSLPVMLHKADIVIAVSKPAVEWADKILSDHHQCWPKTPLYLAVGQKTADKFSNYIQQTVNCPVISDSEHLLELPELQRVREKNIVILRGNGGRELIYSQLSSKGALVHYCEVYQRQALEFNGHSKAEEWQQSGVNHIVVTSAEQLSILLSSVPDDFLPWLFAQILLVPSARISDIASGMGFQKIKVTGSASNPELLATIQSLSTIGYKHDKQE